MNNFEFTNHELTELHNALTSSLFYVKKRLSTWIGLTETNPSATACVKMMKNGISSYSKLIEKIESIRGF